MFAQLPKPTVFAHRGASAYAPENTLAAFELAIQQGAPAIELDAKLSADKHVVVIHDQTVDRTTSGHGKVGELTLAELRQLDAGSHFDFAFRGEPIPTLDEVFASLGQQIFINVELTNYASPLDALPEKVAGLVHRYNLAERVLFSSFNPLALLRIRRLVPQAPLGLLALPGQKGALARSWLGRLLLYQSLHPNFNDVTEKLVQDVHHRGQQVFVYTVNQAEDIRRMIELKVDGIITNDPAIALQTLSLVN